MKKRIRNEKENKDVRAIYVKLKNIYNNFSRVDGERWGRGYHFYPRLKDILTTRTIVSF